MDGTISRRLLYLKVWGENACFTRPEMKVDRVSYDVLTPSAARGILEAILWKPGIRWHVEQVDVLKPVRWTSITRHEVGSVMSPVKRHLFIEQNRQTRAGLILRDVAYTIHCRIESTERGDAGKSIRKHQEMFMRRALKGQCFHRPYLGCREFTADFELVPDSQDLPTPIADSADLGFILHDIDYSGGNPTPRFFHAHLLEGRLKIPPFTQASS